ncbi:MAG: ribosome small subunit-dependent GTPase A [Bradymonadia bacterium]|jgi:ribosome biogenesis GTPase
MSNEDQSYEGRVIEVLGPVVFVSPTKVGTGQEEPYACSLVGRRFRAGKPVAGDLVRFTIHSETVQGRDYQGVITEILPRSSLVQRLDPHSLRARSLVANLDTLVVVASVGAPALKTGLIDRYLVCAHHWKLEPLICFSKWELAEELDLIYMRIYEALGYCCIPCSAHRGDGLDKLRKTIQGRSSAFLGHSGVGKSSLLNRFFPEVNLAVGELSIQSQRGRHTTSSARLLNFDEGGFVIDTPGVREFGIADIKSAELANYFPEFTDFSADCKFQPCTHRHEPRCAVLEALQRDDLARFRYDSYLKIYDELAGYEASRY